jgi:hypothetical protein
MHAFTLNQLNHMHNTGSHNPVTRREQREQQQQQQQQLHQKAAEVPNNTHKSHIPASSPLALKLPPSQTGSKYLSRSLATLNQMSLDEEPCGPSNTSEPGGVAVAPAPTGMPPRLAEDHSSLMASSSASSDVLAHGRELEARFEELMEGVGGDGVRGFQLSEARDFAAVGFV